MFDIAWTELGVIAVVALVVIGPKDLPKVLRTVGTWTAKARGLAREFQQGLDDIVRESELQEIKKAAEQAANLTDIEKQVKNAIDPGGAIEKSIREVADIGNLAPESAMPGAASEPAPAPIDSAGFTPPGRETSEAPVAAPAGGVTAGGVPSEPPRNSGAAT